MTTGEYISLTAELPWSWGSQDCTLWVADWCIHRWGFDPARRFRGRYSTGEAACLLMACGMITRVGPEIPLNVKAHADEGDIAVIRIMGKQVAALRSESYWAFRTVDGVGFVKGRALRIWGD